jgi:hypothetical protein
MALSLAEMARTDPSGFARIAEVMQAHSVPRDPSGKAKPPVKRTTIYPPGTTAPLEIWTVDRADWIAAGAVETLSEAESRERGNKPPGIQAKEADASRGPGIDVLRQRYRDVVGEKPHGRMGEATLRQRIAEAEASKE